MAPKHWQIGDWCANPNANQIDGPNGSVELEPKVMDLLILLARQPGEVLSKPEIAEALWGNVHVNDDALTRTVFKLRKALGDKAREALYLQTVPKRGYRLIADVTPPAVVRPASLEGKPLPIRGLIALGLIVVSALVVLGVLVGGGADDAPAMQAERIDSRMARADGFYFRFTRADNEAALRLYESVLESEPDRADALAGLANALTQRVIRYTGPDAQERARPGVAAALAAGWLATPEAEAASARAVAFARQATERDPGHARAWRALGLALSAHREFEPARLAYERALVIEPDDWGALINLSEISQLSGQSEHVMPYMERAWDAMQRRYDRDAVEIGPWQSAVGIRIAESHTDAGSLAQAETWYRRVLALDPLNPAAIHGLAALLRAAGDIDAARALCQDLAAGTDETC